MSEKEQNANNQTMDLKEKQKLGELAKAAGFVDLYEFATYAATTRQTLGNWLKNEPERFDAIIKGAIVRKVEDRIRNY